jgi:hypothetical protein
MARTSFAAGTSAARVAATLLFAASILGLTSIPGHAAIHCGGDGYCSCSGDDDCNRMFTDLCTDKGGQCTGSGDSAACTCNQKANVAKGNPNRHPIHTPPRFPVHGGPVRGRPIYSKPIITKPIQKKPPTSAGPVVLERSGPKH